MEIRIIKFLQSFSTPFLDGFFKAVTNASSYITFAVCLVFIFLFVSKRIAINFGLCYGSAFGFNVILKLLFGRPRPYEIDSGIRNILQSTGSAFPSGHAVSVTVIMTFMAYIVSKKVKPRWLRIILYILIVLFVLLTYVSRMYLGAHFLSDVLVGGVIGLAFCVVFYFLYKRFQVKSDEKDDNEDIEQKKRFSFFKKRKAEAEKEKQLQGQISMEEIILSQEKTLKNENKILNKKKKGE